MGIVEGLTEFLPISSTGHLILTGALLHFDDEKAKVFDIAIQTGAIVAVILFYWQKIRETLVQLPTQEKAQRFATNVVVAFLPAAVLGVIFAKAIKAYLVNGWVVAPTYILGAGVDSMWKERAMLSAADRPRFGVGFLFSFIFAWLCVRWLLRYISTHSFTPFAWYRIAFGIVVLATALTGSVHRAD